MVTIKYSTIIAGIEMEIPNWVGSAIIDMIRDGEQGALPSSSRSLRVEVIDDKEGTVIWLVRPKKRSKWDVTDSITSSTIKRSS